MSLFRYKSTRTFSDKLILSGLSLLCMFCDTPGTSEKPNVILIMSDDQAWGDTELNGNNIIDTPNLNKIAAEGVQFERFFVCPMCSPTRASLLTGRYNLRCGTSWVGRRTEMLNLDEKTLADIFKSEGYTTGCFGKWHLGLYHPYHPNERGFDEFTGFLDGALNNYFNSHLDHNGKKFITDNEYITDYLTDKALDFISRNKNRPFFCYIPYNVPHHPFQVPGQYFRKYIEKGVIEDKRVAAVYAMIENMDDNIGRIITTLRNLNLDEKTIVIFLSDNGPQFKRYNDGLKGIKAQIDEGSTRVPCYMRWKDHLPEGRHIFGIASVIDILPTLLELTGIDMPEDIEPDGISLLPLINVTRDQNTDRMIFTHQTMFGETRLVPGSVRTQRYRLVNNRDQYELYDMDVDPYQKTNVASKFPQITEKLKVAYEKWYSDVTSELVGLPPVPIGFPGEDTVSIVAPDAILKGKLGYNNKYGWSNAWNTNWSEEKDSVIWPVEVYTPGDYDCNLIYTCDEKSVGTIMQLSAINIGIRKMISIPHVPGYVTLPNVLSDLSPVLKESWGSLPLGRMRLQKGRHNLVLQAVEIHGKSAGEFLALELIKK